MPRGFRAAGCATNPTSSSYGSQGIWITDDLLANTFRNFTHRHRRYGSNVPGPLEARRRASKRKNTSLAHHATPPVDPSMLLRAGPQHGWWQKPELAITKPVPSLFPAWLLQPPERAIPQDRDFAVTDVELGQLAGHEEEQTQEKRFEHELRRNLQHTHKHGSVREVVEGLGVNLRQNPCLARIAFDYVLHVYWEDTLSGTNLLQEILTDPMLNPPGSSHHSMLLQELCNRPVSRKSWEATIFTAVQSAVRLGLISVEDLRKILGFLPEIHETSGLAAIREGEKLLSEFHRLFTAIEDSKVLTFEDIGFETLHTLYQRLVSGTPSDNAISLLWRLRKFSGKEEIDVVAELVTLKLQHLVEADIAPTTKFKAWISTLPEDLRGPAVLRTSQSLVAAAVKGNIRTSEIERWYETFSSLNEDNCTHVIIDKNTWNEALRSFGDLDFGQNLLVLAWTVTYLNTKNVGNSNLLASFGFREQFLQAFTESAHGLCNDPLGHVMMTLDTLPLPAKDTLYGHLQQFTDESLMSMLGHKSFEEDIKALAERDLTKLNDEQFYQWAKLNASDPLAELAKAVTTDLLQFQSLAQNLIMKNKTTFKIVRRILQHNLPIKLALPIWPEHAAFQQNSYGAAHHIDSTKATDLLHHLAISFAITPVISARSAFRQVYQLYIYLHRYGGQINPLMSRALWHAGVTRYGKDGTSSTQLSWCLERVRDIEGSAVANMLLWSGGYRRLRTTELTTEFNNYEPFTAAEEPALPLDLEVETPLWAGSREDELNNYEPFTTAEELALPLDLEVETPSWTESHENTSLRVQAEREQALRGIIIEDE